MRNVVRGVASLFFIVGSFAFLCILEEAIEAALQGRSKINLKTSGRVSLDGAA